MQPRFSGARVRTRKGLGLFSCQRTILLIRDGRPDVPEFTMDSGHSNSGFEAIVQDIRALLRTQNNAKL